MFHGGAVPGWTVDFDQWAAAAIAAGDLDELAAYRDRAPGMPYAHPTPEHFTPLFVTLGAADGPVTTVIEGTAFGLAKRSLEVA
jgi:4,5-DOPA dioxygenase extradiol